MDKDSLVNWPAGLPDASRFFSVRRFYKLSPFSSTGWPKKNVLNNLSRHRVKRWNICYKI